MQRRRVHPSTCDRPDHDLRLMPRPASCNPSDFIHFEFSVANSAASAPRESNLDAALAKIREVGYAARSYAFDAKDWGLPQRRPRLYIVAAKQESLFKRAEEFYGLFEKCMDRMSLPPQCLERQICFLVFHFCFESVGVPGTHPRDSAPRGNRHTGDSAPRGQTHPRMTSCFHQMTQPSHLF